MTTSGPRTARRRPLDAPTGGQAGTATTEKAPCAECDKLDQKYAAALNAKGGPDWSELTDVAVMRTKHRPDCPREVAR